MGERGSKLKLSLSSSGRSTLSPLAPPFTIKRHRQHLPIPDPSSEALFTSPNNPCASVPLQLLQPSIPNLSLEGNSTSSPLTSSVYYYDYFDNYDDDPSPLEARVTTFCLADQAKPYYPQGYPLHGTSPLNVSYGPSDSILVSTETAGGSYRSSNCHSPSYGDPKGSFWQKQENVGGGSSTYSSLQKQEFSAAESSKTWGKTVSLYDNCTHGPGRDDQVRSGGMERINAECFSFLMGNPTVAPTKISTSSVAGLKDVSQLLGLWRPHLTTTLERCFSQNNSCMADPTVTNSSENNSQPTLVFESLSASPTFSALNPLVSENVNSGSSDAVNKEDNSGNKLSSKKEPNATLKTEGKEACYNGSFIDKGKGIKTFISVESSSEHRQESSSGKSISHHAMNTSYMAKSELQVIHSNLLDEITSESHCAEAGSPVEKSPEVFDKPDSDLDSPCWKGTLASCNSPFRVSETLNSHFFDNGLGEGISTLNPLAPQFVPGNAGGRVDYCGNGCFGDNSSSFSMDSTVINASSGEHQLAVAVEAGSCSSKASSVIRTQYFNDIHVTREDSALPNKSNSSSEMKHSHVAQQNLLEDYCTSKGKPVLGASLAASVNGVKDVGQDGSSCEPSCVTDHVFSLPSGVPTELTETFQSASNSLSIPPKIDVQIVVNAMHNLSEFLLQNCSNDLYSLTEHDHDTLRHIINNLCMCIRKSVGQRTPMCKSPQPSISYYPKKPTELLKVTMREAASVSRQHDNVKQKGCFIAFSEKDYKVHDYSSSSAGESGIEKGNNIYQVMDKALKENHQIKEEMHPQALIYKNLWLEAEAALRLLKYKACSLRMKTEIGECNSDKIKHT
ncbi:hypothetical protein F0562_007840 [Nyssa sinensis]|uniref:Uncharacterized protein n=1 Tax=Nyssa sinensis TaxID=561372 RepID=A0A5J5A6F5_9ASTE|nr:hypothetical protein F0562_007840 [Nyssa sinensis]